MDSTLTPVATPHHQRPIGLAGSRVHRLLAMQHDAAQPDRMATGTGPADLLQPALALGITHPGDQAPHRRGIQLVDGRDGHWRRPTVWRQTLICTAHNPRTPGSRLVPTPASASGRDRSGFGASVLFAGV
jgi:hypothetical protein